MLARQVLVGVIALLTAPWVPAQQAQRDQWQPFRFLLNASQVSDEITSMDVVEVGINGVQTAIVVELHGHVGTVGRLAGMTIEVWLLRSDGTTVAQQQTFPCYDCLESIPPTDHRQFRFAATAVKDLVGVVVSVKGRFYGRAITAPSDAGATSTTAWTFWAVSTPDVVGDFQGNVPGFRSPSPATVSMPTVGNQTDSAGEFGGLIDTEGRATFDHTMAAVRDIDTGAVRRVIGEWRFTPATLDGKPIRVRLRIQVSNSARK